jgi:hypothetical protein
MKDQCSPDTPDDCCGHKIAAGINRRASGSIDSDVNVRCRNGKNAPCVMPPANDPCAESPCKNGASCGAQYIPAPEGCTIEPVCECSSIPAGTVPGTVSGSFSGTFCEVQCAPGESPCGGGVYEYDRRAGLPNKKCCSAGRDCLRVASKYGYTSGECLLCILLYVSNSTSRRCVHSVRQ